MHVPVSTPYFTNNYIEQLPFNQIEDHAYIWNTSSHTYIRGLVYLIIYYVWGWYWNSNLLKYDIGWPRMIISLWWAKIEMRDHLCSTCHVLSCDFWINRKLRFTIPFKEIHPLVQFWLGTYQTVLTKELWRLLDELEVLFIPKLDLCFCRTKEKLENRKFWTAEWGGASWVECSRASFWILFNCEYKAIQDFVPDGKIELLM
jgi:hypothetical protein